MEFKEGMVFIRVAGTKHEVEREFRLPEGSCWQVYKVENGACMVDEMPTTSTSIPQPWLDSDSFMHFRPLDGSVLPVDYLARQVRRLNPEQRAQFDAAVREGC